MNPNNLQSKRRFKSNVHPGGMASAGMPIGNQAIINQMSQHAYQNGGTINVNG